MEAVTFTIVDAGSDAARFAMGQYFAELDSRFVGGFEVEAALEAAKVELNPPNGCLVLGLQMGEVAACGGIYFIDDNRAEIKRMWVGRQRRGFGLGKRLLAHLEAEVAATGRTTVILDTNSVLIEAITMYQTSGYEPIERYNDNPYAQLWFAKNLLAS